MSSTFKSIIVLAILALFSSVATADPVVFTDRTLFNTATAGSPRFTENFQGFTADTSFRTAPVNFNGFSLQQINLTEAADIFRNLIDTPPLVFGDNNGTTGASLFTDSGLTAVDLMFTIPVFAFGGEFFGTTGGELLDVTLFTNTGTFLLPVTADTGFFGFINSSQSELVSRIRFTSRLTNPSTSNTQGEGFGLDDVVGVTPSVAQPAAVPEPATMLLFGTGLAGIGAAAVRKRRKAEKNKAA